MMNWLKRLMGGSDSSTSSDAAEPASAPEPPSMPSEPSEPAVAPTADEPAGDEPA